MPKMKSYTVKYKLDVIDWHNSNGKSGHKTAKHFKIDRKRIREWLSIEDSLRANSRGKSSERKKLHQGTVHLKLIKCLAIFKIFKLPYICGLKHNRAESGLKNLCCSF